MDIKKIGEFIAKNRKLKGLTQEQLGEKLGVSNKTVSRWENGNYMPDLSLLKPLSEVLGITLNELLSGEKIEKESIIETAEKSLANTIDYTEEKINNEHKKISFIIMAIGIILSFSAFTIFDVESSWCSVYSELGILIFVIGVFRELKMKALWKKILTSIIIFIGVLGIFFTTDYIGVVNFKRPPIYRYKTKTTDIISYYNSFYTVYRINPNTKNEYYIIDTKKEYNEETVPRFPFNKDKSGIDNIIRYQNKYVGNNSNDGNLIGSLPLSEYGYVFKIDTENLGLIINYNATDWYINQDSYLQKSLVYNTVSIFSLIENVEYIKYNFSGNSYEITRKEIEESYPNYSSIVEDGKVNTKAFKENIEQRMNDIDFIEEIYEKVIK